MYSKVERVCALECGDGFAIALPSHPRGGFSPILTAEVASHVLTPLLPPLQDVGVDVHVARGFSSREAKVPVVTVIWFRASSVRPVVDMQRVFARLRVRAVACANLQRASANALGTIQGASGVYVESGLGVLAGTGRHSVVVDGVARSVPYVRTSLMAEDEALLAELMHGVACVVENVEPGMVRREHDLLLQRGHQYPRQRLHGDPFIASHQAVLRACGGPGDPQGSDLHVDSMDGRGDADGSWTVYAGEAPSDFDRLAVFAGPSGGSGFDVKVGGFGREWVCAVHFDTAHRLHGSVWPNASLAMRDSAIGSGLRVVTYTLRRIELLESSVVTSPEEEDHAIEASMYSVRQRMLGR